MVATFGPKIKYSENLTAQKMANFHGLIKDKKHILNQKGDKL